MKVFDFTNREKYSSNTGYGIIDRALFKEHPFKEFELANGFTLPEEMEEEPTEHSFFRIDVEGAGNYNVTIYFESQKVAKEITIFVQRRQFQFKNIRINSQGKNYVTCTVNVCDTIPIKNTSIVHNRHEIDITCMNENGCLTRVEIEKVDVPTLFLAGDSTVADQVASYPYNPRNNYCGWGQVLPLYIASGIGVANQARSGLTTETFRKEGHWQIIKEHAKSGDWLLMQFGHNDFNREHLGAFGGYWGELERYIVEAKALGLNMILVTCVSRNTWDEKGNTYKHFLKAYVDACQQIANKMDVPVIDLDEVSRQFILQKGEQAASYYFYPKDTTHHNDLGGEIMAKLVACGLKQMGLPISDFVLENHK